MNRSHSTSDTQASPGLTTYVTIYIALLALMAATVIAAYMPLGRLNVPVALVIAFTKTVLVALFFMHVRYSGKLIWVVAAGALVWLAILLSIYHDYLTRDWTPNRVSVGLRSPSSSLPGSAREHNAGQALPALPKRPAGRPSGGASAAVSTQGGSWEQVWNLSAAPSAPPAVRAPAP